MYLGPSRLTSGHTQEPCKFPLLLQLAYAFDDEARRAACPQPETHATLHILIHRCVSLGEGNSTKTAKVFMCKKVSEVEGHGTDRHIAECTHVYIPASETAEQLYKRHVKCLSKNRYGTAGLPELVTQ